MLHRRVEMTMALAMPSKIAVPVLSRTSSSPVSLRRTSNIWNLYRPDSTLSVKVRPAADAPSPIGAKTPKPEITKAVTALTRRRSRLVVFMAVTLSSSIPWVWWNSPGLRDLARGPADRRPVARGLEYHDLRQAGGAWPCF
jgi:hypothetical protein